MKRQIGSIVYMNDDAIENYGEEYRGIPLKITHRATRSMPPKEFYKKGKPQGYHPGYDKGVSPMCLYDFVTLGNDQKWNKEIPFSLYEWEIDSFE